VTNKQRNKNNQSINRSLLYHKKTPDFSFSRRRTAADLYHALHEDRGCPFHFCTPLDFFSIGVKQRISQVSEREEIVQLFCMISFA